MWKGLLVNLGTLTAFLSLDTSGFDSGVQDAERETSSLGGRLKGNLGKAAGIASAGLAAAGAAAAKAAFKVAGFGDDLDKRSAKIGVTTDFLQDMRYWASQNGIEASTLERAVGRLNQRIGDAADGTGKYADAFDTLGVSLHDANGDLRDTEDVMQDTISALMDIEDPQLRAAAAADVFGDRVARDLAPALRDGSLTLEDATAAMDDMGRMSEDQIATAVEFSDSWDTIKTVVGNALRQGLVPIMNFMSDHLFPAIQEKVIPALSNLTGWLGPKLTKAGELVGQVFENHILPAVERLSGWWEANGPAIIAMANRVRDRVVEFATRAGQMVGRFADVVSDAVDTVIGWFQNARRTTDDTSSRMSKVWESLRKTAETVWNAISDVVDVTLTAVRKVVETVTGIVQRLWERFGDDILRYAQTTWDAIMRAIDGVLNIISGLFDTFAGLFTGDWERVWSGVRSIASGIWDVIGGAFEYLMGALKLAWEVFKAPFEDAWEATWTWVRDFVSGIWDDVEGAFDSAMDFITGAVSGAVDAIAGIWNGLRSAFAKPVNWIIDNVLNRFIAAVENLASKIPGVSLNLGRIPNVSTGESGGPPTRVSRPGESGGLPHGLGRPIGHSAWSDSELDEAGGPLAALKRAGSSVLSTVRETVANVARPAVERAMRAATEMGGRFGPLGEILGGASADLGRQILDWIAGVDKTAEENQIGGADLGGSGSITSRLAQYMAGSGVPHRFTSGYRPGDPGLHGQARAADFAGPTPSAVPTPAMNRIFDHLARLSGLRELIYAGRPWNIIRGRRVPTSSLSPALVRAHRNHVHAAMDSGGTLQPGMNLVYNGLGKPEPLARADQMVPVLERIERELRRSRGRPIEATFDLGEGVTARMQAFHDRESARLASAARVR